MSGPVMFYVQHLLGIGHVMRAAAIVREITRRSVPATLVSGGEAVAMIDAGDAEFIQLPPAKAMDRTFKPLYDGDSRPIDDAWRERRRRRLIEIFENLRPSVVMIELFPFGRRQFRFELIPLLEAAKAARPRPHVVSSVRDILVEKEIPERNLEMLELAQAHFDTILVHGDPNFISFDATFPPARRLDGKLRYTGYVVDNARAAKLGDTQGTGEVIVSVGGGGVGEELLRAALGARRLCSLKKAPWRLLVGHNLPEERLRALTAEAPDGFIVERARADFPALLANCRLSISQGGYNTVMEILAAKAPNIIVPYAGAEENEQTLRAHLLKERGLARVLNEAELSPTTLAAAIDAAPPTPPPGHAPPIDMNGANVSADFIAGIAKINKNRH